jgi:cytochrome c oxidase subunit 2
VKRLWFALAALAYSAAAQQQSALNPAGPQSGRIAGLWWFFFYLLGAIFIIVMLIMLRTLMRGHRNAEENQPLENHERAQTRETRLRSIVTVSSVVTVVLLFILLVASISIGKANADLGASGKPMIIQVIGNQWWWQFSYLNDDPSQVLTTANEIHIPIGKTVLIQGQSNDVIHSFWVPNLHGKRDLIPSRVTTEYIRADRPGIYRGQCAEFCGLQHAHMAFYIVAEPEDKFKAWMQAQLQPAVAPATPALAQGQQNFLNYACVYCHQIRGTTASGTNGPDLTHFGSRRTIAAGTLPNTPGNLGGWIVNPQSIKPGNHMATIAVKPDDLQPMIQYLESLK